MPQPCRATGRVYRLGDRSRSERNAQAKIFNGVFTGKERQSRVNNLGLAGLNNSSKLWAIGVVSSCLHLVLDDLGEGKYWLCVCV